MEITAYVVNGLIAAALGAGTNELAIVTILRYILPRKKGEIARRIRDLIATDLMSPDKLRDKLDDPVVSEVLVRNVDSALGELFSRDLPSPDELLANHMGEVDGLVGRLRLALMEEFGRRVSEPNFAAGVIRPFLAERWEVLRRRTPGSLLTEKADKLPGFVVEWVESFEGAEAVRGRVRRALDNWLAERIRGAGSPADILSPGLVVAAEELAASQAPVIVKQLTNILREPDVANTIAAGIMNAIHGQLRGQGMLGELKGVFVSAIGVRDDVRGVCRRLPDELEANFQRPMNRERLVGALRTAVRKALSQDLNADFKSPEQRGRIVDMLMDGLWRHETFARLGEKAGEFVESTLSRTIEDTVNRLGVGGAKEGVLDEAAVRCQRILASEATAALLGGQFDELTAAWRRRPLGRLDRFIAPEARGRLAALAAREGREMIQARLADFAEQSGIWDIVVSSIESYDDKELADMIVQLARSELRWVTILGGVIGLVVGILQTALHSFGLF